MNIQINKHNIDELISEFGKRETPDAQMMANAQINVKAHWLKSVAQQKNQQKLLSMLRIAASFFAITTVILLAKMNIFATNTQIIQTVGNLLYAQGTIEISKDNHHWHPLTDTKQLKSGQWLKTDNNSYANFALNDNSQIRLNANSLIHLDSSEQIQLLQGEIYHDADLANAKALLIKTKFGNIQHVGTRYAVAVNDQELTVKVRNGLVKLASAAINRTFDAGKMVELFKTGEIKQSNITPYDASWSWTKKASKPLAVNHQSLGAFIKNYAHENGLQINWHNQQEQVSQVKIVGDFAQLSEKKLLKTVFLSTKFDFVINQGILTINP
jgi:hypothetical protein